MSMGGSIGDVSIGVELDASDAASQVEKATKGPLQKAGENLSAALGKGLSNGFAKTAASAAGSLVSPLTSKINSGLGKAGEAVGATLRKALGPQLSTIVGNFAVSLTTAEGKANALAGAATTLGQVLRTAVGPAAAGSLDRFRDGFTNASAAASAFSGVAGKIGGLARSAWDTATTAASGFAAGAKSVFSAVSGAASAAWSKISAGAAKAFAATGKAMRDTLSTSAKLAGGAVAGILGTALTKGFNRLQAIDTATAKLKGLGKSAGDIESIMKSATAAVKGTAFGLGDAASAAAAFSAAGVPLDQIQRSLSVLASTSSVAGADLNEMSVIFGKVAATGKLNGEVVQQLAERGVPVLSLLSKQLGVTTGDVQKMVSSGKIDFATFQNALEGGLGPAAAAMGQSFSGMLSNVGAALGRFGAAAQAPAFNALKTLFPAMISLVDQFTAAVTPLATQIGTVLAPAAEKLAGFLSGIKFDVTAEGASSFLAAMGPLLPAIGGLLGLMGPLLSDIPVLGKLFVGLSGPVGIFAGALVALTAIKPETLMKGFDSLATALPGMITKLATAASTLLPQMIQRIATNAGIFVNGVIQILTAVVPAIGAAIPQIVTAFAQLIPQLVTSLLAMVPTLLGAALQLFQSLVTAAVTALPLVVQSLVAMLPQLAQAVITALPLIIQAALSLFQGILTALVQATPIIIQAVLDLLPVLIESLLSMLPAIIDAALNLFLGLVTGLLDALPDIIVAVLDMLPEIISTLIGMIPRLIEAAVQLFTGLVDALPKVLPKLVDALFKIAPKLVETIIKMVPLLIQAGVDLIGGLVKGLMQAAGSVGSALLKIAQDAIGGFLNFLGIHSPSKKFAQFGKDIIDGLALGLKKSASSAVSEMQSTAKRIAKAVDDKVISKATGKALTARLTATTKSIQKALTQREAVLDKLKDAQDRFDDLTKERAQFVASIASGVSDLGSIVDQKSTTKMVANLQKQLAATVKFTDTIKQLTALGLDKASIQELTENFAKTGSSKAADALLAGGADAVKQVADLRGQLDKAGEQLGNSVGDTMYKAGIDAAAGLVKGLESQAAALQKIADGLADSLVSAIKKKLGIKSPSTVLAEVGVNTMIGYMKGIESMADKVSTTIERAILPPDVSSTVALQGTSLAPGAGRPTSTTSTYTNTKTVEAPITVVNPDTRRAALEVADAIAEEVST